MTVIPINYIEIRDSKPVIAGTRFKAENIARIQQKNRPADE
jgi:hypothetical protein